MASRIPRSVGPIWITVERYDIVAKPGGPTSEEQLKLMSRALLAERFRLVVHSDTRTLSVIALALGKDRPKLRESTTGGPGTLRSGRGRYDFTLDFSSFVPEPGQTVDEMTATVAVVEQQLGLKLESRKLPTQILVVDRADRVPVEN
jgi:Protein of unknown function (DUF3738)